MLLLSPLSGSRLVAKVVKLVSYRVVIERVS